MYHIKELSPDIITVPIGVEAVWALLIPRISTSGSSIKQIVVASVYYSSNQTRSADFVDHISQSYHILCSKYGSNLKFLISGDLNRLRLGPILNLSPDLHQVVQVPTRRNPDATLDLIITNLHAFFHPPVTLEPLENDEGNGGKPSDHLPVMMYPLTNENPKQAKKYKIIKFRAYPDSAIREMGQWLQSQSWHDIFKLSCANAKAEKLEEMLLDKINVLFPEKILKVNENDKPWINPELKKLDRVRKKEYIKNKKSDRWKELNSEFLKKSSEQKQAYYKNMVSDLKTSNTSQWYSKIKRMSTLDQTKDNKVIVQKLIGVPSKSQAEQIADQFASISNLYEPLKSEDIEIPGETSDSQPLPIYEPIEICEKIKSMKKKSSTVPGDIPWKIISEFAVELAEPLSNIYNSSTLSGVWPNIWKFEYVTPVPKVFPPDGIDDLRKISGTKNFSKIYEALISEPIIMDMAPNMDKSQFGNVKGLSIQHYLVKIVNRILTILDTNNDEEKYAVISQLIDWSKAFDRQDPTLGIQSFIENGVRPSLIPLLISYFQDRKMVVKWHGTTSTERDLPGGGPQGCTLGLIEYKSNSNDNANHIPANMRFKFVDDLSALEKLNLILAGLCSYNFKNHVASDVGTHQLFLPGNHTQSQLYLDGIQNWTDRNQMELNEKKSKVMIFNYTKNFQFSTRLYLGETLLNIISETKLLGTIITDDLTWHKNTDYLVKKGYQRMIILQKLFSFNVSEKDMTLIYIMYIRSILEQSCQVWHFSIKEEEKQDLERVQKVACKIILNKDYTDYEQALAVLKLDKLIDRRQKL